MKMRFWIKRKNIPFYLIGIFLSALTLTYTACSDDDDDKIVYTVTFETDVCTPVPSVQKVEEGSAVTPPSTYPTKEGYAFVCWHLSGETTAYNFQSSVNNDITLYAKWQDEVTSEYWQVTWNLDGGSWPSGDNHATQVLKGGTLIEPAEPTKTGSFFHGWYKESALTNEVIFPYDVSNVTADFTLYAKWGTGERQLSVSPDSPITFTNVGGASEVKTITVTTNQSSWNAVSSESWCTIKKSGNEFTVTASGNTASTERTAVITVSAGRAENVTINVTQGGVVSVVKAEYEVPRISALYNPVRANYTITWPAVTGATEYNVYKSTAPSGEGKLVTTTSDVTMSTSETLTTAGTHEYYYWVTAIMKTGATPRPDNGGIKVSYAVTLKSKVWMPNSTPPLYGYWMTVGTDNVERSVSQNPIK